MKRVFICSPYRGDVEVNVTRAKFAARVAVGCGYLPIVPHLYFPAFLNDSDEHERIEGIKLGIELMKEVSEIWVVGTEITAGMAFELNAAKKHSIPVRIYDDKLREIDPATMMIDDRVSEEYRKAIHGLKFV